uniref:Integrase catalytic domain-containing protein n=1 Tax=Aegilops tauschii subsp. strangulata TaxID=200361 RepID=A0A453MCF6_AEGTS
WTSPVTSFSGFAYYLVVLDHYTHYSWTFPLRAKSDTSPTLLRFFQYILTQFHVLIKCMQYDNGGSSSIQPFVPFSLIMGFRFTFLAPTPHPKTGRPNACYAQPTT